MARRGVLGVLLVAAWLGGTVLGSLGAAFRTEAGRRAVIAEGVRQANARLNGTLTIGAAGGSLLEGLQLRDVSVRDASGATVLRVAWVGLRYRLRDLLSGRISLGQLVLEEPYAELVQARPGAPFNFEELLPAGRGGGGPGPLVAFTDVRIERATVVVRTPAEPGNGRGDATGGDGSDGFRVRRIERLAARLPYVRLASPLPREDAIVVEIGALAAHLTDPPLTITELKGRVDVWGDSLTLNLSRAALAETEGALSGTLAWGADTLLLDLTARATRLVTDEIRALAPELPAGLRGRGDFRIRSLSGDVVEVLGAAVVLDGDGGGGRLEGRFGIVLGPGGEWRARDTRLRLRHFDLEFVRGFVDTLPIAGRVDGLVAADGARSRLALELDVALRDSLVEGWPRSTVRAAGVLELNDADGAVFHDFEVRSAALALGTVSRLIPAVELQGTLEGSGTLAGPWLAASFTGTLRHVHAPLPPTLARGSLRFDARGETLGVWAHLAFDSLRLAGLASSYPALGLDLTLAGEVVLAGYLDSLVITARLEGPAGQMRGAGSLYVLDRGAGTHELDVTFGGLDLARFAAGAPATALAGRLRGRGGTAADRPPELRAELELDSAVVRGVVVDSAYAAVSLGDSVFTLNALRLWAGEVRMRGGGRLGMALPRRGTLTVSVFADSIGALEPLVASWLGVLPPGAARPAGAIAGTLTLDGALDAYRARATFEATSLRREELFVSRLDGRVDWVSDAHGLALAAEVDSLDLGELWFRAGQLEARGRPDSLAWFARTRFGSDGAWLAGGRMRRESGGTEIVVDSMGVLVGPHIWFAERGAVVSVGDSGIDFREATIASVQHAGRIAVSGRLPFDGPGMLTASVQALPLRDLWILLQKDAETVGGELSGTLDLSGRARAPTLEARVNLREGVFGEFRAPVVRAAARYGERRLVSDVSLHRAGEEIIKIDVELPVDLAIRGVERRRLPGPIRVRAVAQGMDLALLEATTPLLRRTSGTLDADFGIAGTWERPELTGRVHVRNGAATFPALGVRHEELNADLRLSGDTIAIERFAVRSGQGAAELGGFVRLEELTRPVLNVRIAAQNFRTLDVRDFLSVTGSGTLELTGPLARATLTGRATVNRGVLYFADLIEKDVINLQDTLFREFLDTTLIRRQGLGPEFQGRFLDSLRIDSVRVEMGTDVWMRSSEANIQLAGAVAVSKLRGQYRLTGTLQTPRGTYRLETPPPAPISKEFTVTRGQVRYFGTPDLNADLDIEARHLVRTVRGDQVTIFVQIGGTLYEPRLTLSSDIRPAISETEIISYLLFGAPSVQAFGAAGVEARRAVAQTLASLISGQIEYSLVSNLGIPVDYLQIRPGEAGGAFAGTEIAIGKQFRLLGTTAFLTANPRICPQQSPLDLRNVGASLEFRLSREWLFATSVDPSQSCGAFPGSAAEAYQFGFDVFWDKSF